MTNGVERCRSALRLRGSGRSRSMADHVKVRVVNETHEELRLDEQFGCEGSRRGTSSIGAHSTTFVELPLNERNRETVSLTYLLEGDADRAVCLRAFVPGEIVVWSTPVCVVEIQYDAVGVARQINVRSGHRPAAHYYAA